MSFSATHDAKASLASDASWTFQHAIIAAGALLAEYSILNAWILADLGRDVLAGSAFVASFLLLYLQTRPSDQLFGVLAAAGFIALVAKLQPLGRISG